MMGLLKVAIEYDEMLDKLVFMASDPPFERMVYLQRGEAWNSAIDSIQEAWRRWRNQ